MCSNNGTSGKKWTFWSFLKEYSIEIPIIQRDYAQGRPDKESLRRNFLKSIKEALDKKGELLLDFVYGSLENGKLQPLDGQQRLTTLWLLHWYIAYKANKLTDKVKETLKKFTYETRISSREFCEKLASFDAPQLEGTNIVEHIKNQTWFHSSWEQDPTISAMLTMLGGTKSDDGIEPVFTSVGEKDCEDLMGEDCPIKFLHQPLEGFSLSDDLYVKMNARGKQLTNFENLKADIVGYIEQKIAKKEKGWKELSDVSLKMDTTWLDIFWNNRSSDNKVDGIYFTFLNRFFLNYNLSRISDGDEYYNYFNSDTSIQYESIDKYKLGGGIECGLFENLKNVLDNYCGSLSNLPDEIFACPWGTSFEFIPKNTNGTIDQFRWIQRVVFYAVCKYFAKDKVEEDSTSLKRWMRFVWNLVSVKEITNEDQMTMGDYINSLSETKKAINIISQVDSHNVYDVYESLQTNSIKNCKGALYGRFEEEIEKARAICENIVSEDKIREAEKYAFFQGGIGFLFRDEEGRWDWNDFERKFEKAQKYFDGAKGEYTNNAMLLKRLIGHFKLEDINELHMGERRMYNNKEKTWYFLLNNKNILGPIHKLLTEEENSNTVDKGESNSEQRVLWYMSNTILLDYVVKEMPDACFRASGPFKAFFNKDKRVLLGPGPNEEKDFGELLNAHCRNENEKNTGKMSIASSLYERLYEQGHFIYQEKNKKRDDANGKWGDIEILMPSKADGTPVIMGVEEYRKEYKIEIEIETREVSDKGFTDID